MSTGYEAVESALSHLQSTVETAVQRDMQDIQTLKRMLLLNPALLPVHAAVTGMQFVVFSNVRAALAAAREACGGELARAAKVVTKKEAEADDWDSRAEDLAGHATIARKLGTEAPAWLGDASDLYRDTAQVCADGLGEMRDQFRNSANFCRGVAQYHRVTYQLLAMGISLQAFGIQVIGGVPFGMFFRRSLKAQQLLQNVQTLAAKAASGELARDGLQNLGRTARNELYNTEILGFDFRADPAMAQQPSSSTS